jgi:hypothetical protein
MITISMISFLFGAALGQRFNVLVLMPAMPIVLVLSAAAGITNGQTAWWVVLMVASAAMFLQFGYFAGIGIRHYLVATPSEGSSPLGPVDTSARHAAR